MGWPGLTRKKKGKSSQNSFFGVVHKIQQNTNCSIFTRDNFTMCMTILFSIGMRLCRPTDSCGGHSTAIAGLLT